MIRPWVDAFVSAGRVRFGLGSFRRRFAALGLTSLGGQYLGYGVDVGTAPSRWRLKALGPKANKANKANQFSVLWVAFVGRAARVPFAGRH